MNRFLVKISFVEGEWFQGIIYAETESEAEEYAAEYAESEGMAVSSIEAVLFEQGTHGDTEDYDFLC